MHKGRPLPLRPAGSVRVGGGVDLLETEAGGVVFLFGMAAWCWDPTDVVGRRLAAVSLLATKAANGVEVASAFEIDTDTLRRWTRAFEAGGTEALAVQKKGPKGPSKLDDVKRAEIVLARQAGKSMAEVAEVTGAPGDGDISLAQQMRKRLSLLGPKIQDTAKGADFTVRGHVHVVPLAHHKERVEIQWRITDADGRNLGKVIQLNEIPAGTLDHYWGNVAVVVATQAAAGVEHVMKEHRMVPPEARMQPSALHGQGGNRLLEGRRSGVEPVRQ